MTEDLFHDMRDRLQGATLQMYVSTFCYDCVRLKKLLDANAVAYETVNISKVDGAAEKLERETGKRGVPFMLVNGTTWVRGYHRGGLDAKLFATELAAAL
ncbi:MAG: glutaredoxin family protein [Planctomycetes bacterium]|nr:glutaredoxin family protein [Planctomycetota bacterium]